jgi:small-conductance mechanosensitive channel
MKYLSYTQHLCPPSFLCTTGMLLFFLCYTTACLALPFPLEAKPNPGEPEAKKATKQVVTDKNLADLIPKATELSKKLLEMQTILSDMQDAGIVEDGLQAVSEERNLLQEQLHALQINPKGRYQELAALQKLMQEADINAAAVSKKLDSSIAVFDTWIDYWEVEEQGLSLWQEGLGASSSLPAVQKVLKQLQDTVETARLTINEQLVPLLNLQKKGGELQLSLHSLTLQIEQLFKAKFKHGLVRQAPFLFSFQFAKQFNHKILLQAYEGAALVLRPSFSFLLTVKLELFFSLLLFAILFSTLFASRHSLRRSGYCNFSCQQPAAVSIFISLLFFQAIIQSELPPFWLALVRALFLISIILMCRAITMDNLKKTTITRLSLAMLMTDLLVLFDLPQPLMRLYVFFVVVSCLALFILFKVKNKKSRNKPKWFRWGMAIGASALFVILLAEINGQAELAFFVFSASMKTLFEGLLIWIIYMISLGIIGLIFYFAPFKLLHNNVDQFLQMLRPVLIVTGALTIFSSILVTWRIFPSATAAMDYLANLGITLGENHISLGQLTDAIVLFYGAFCTSKSIKAALVQSIFPRYKVDKGIQLSILRLLHYAIMLIGVLLFLGTIGFSLTSLTIIGGALSVGLGFGLQEIVKNFASGLILLFERPIKVGDTIQVGSELAEVKELGLRATVVQTTNNAEIVMPNADLITGQVMNWTLHQRQVRITVPIGVAYGSDVEKVLGILLSCGNDHPEVLNDPAPSALFSSFGASSLDFELRVFIADFSSRRRVQSELNQALSNEFEDADIEIPFPQNDLHLRSVDPEAAKLLQTLS